MTRFSSLLGSGLVVAAGTGDEERGTGDEGRGTAIEALASGYAPEPNQEQNGSQELPASGSMLAVDNANGGRGRALPTANIPPSFSARLPLG